MNKPKSTFNVLCIGAVLALGVIMLLAANLTTWVGRFVGDGTGLTNVPVSSIVANVNITNGVFQWPLDGTFEDALVKHDTHGIDLDYRKIDGSAATALWRTVDGAFHFTIPPYIDGGSYLGNALGVDPITGQIVPISGATIINNFFTTNVFASTNFVDYFNSYSNAFMTFQSNVVFNQSVTVKGQATFNNITITNNLLFSTNAFPQSPGTTWNLIKNYQLKITNNDWAITAIAGLSNNTVNWGVLKWSNSDSATHFCDLSSLPVTLFGPNSTNKVYAAGGKQAVLSVNIWGNVGDSTNLVTALGQ